MPGREERLDEHNPIRVFVAHVFGESDDYLRIFEYLESNEHFFYINCSEPDRMPSAGTDAVKKELKRQIEAAEAVMLPASLYLEKTDWARYQIKCAKDAGRPIVAVRPFGETGMPSQVTAVADECVAWNNREMADALKRVARHEDTDRWEVIDFP